MQMGRNSNAVELQFKERIPDDCVIYSNAYEAVIRLQEEDRSAIALPYQKTASKDSSCYFSTNNKIQNEIHDETEAIKVALIAKGL